MKRQTAKGRGEEENAVISDLRETANEEAQKWKDVYGDRFPGVVPVDLGCFPCLVMPYGVAIAARNRPSYVERVREELLKVAKCGYRYKYDGVHWRHVLLDKNGVVFLSGFGFLEEHEETSDASLKEIVDAQVDSLTQL